jgi:hypothetical protein
MTAPGQPLKQHLAPFPPATGEAHLTDVSVESM